MGWQERFRNIRQQADERQRQEKQRVSQDRQSAGNLVAERRKLVRALTPQIEKMCKQFNSGVKGRMKPHRIEGWVRGNAAWRLQTDFGGIGVETWPWLHDTNKPRLLRGIWLQYLGHGGEELVSELRVKGTKLDHYYELGREGATSSGYYYWNQADYIGSFCVFGYFLSRDDFTEEVLATVLEDMGLDLAKKLTRGDFARVG